MLADCSPPRWPSDGSFERISQRIKEQIDKIEMMTGDPDPKTNFALIVVQTELERYKYLVRSFLRARIAKVWAVQRLPCA
jgi:GINS complex subunit 4